MKAFLKLLTFSLVCGVTWILCAPLRATPQQVSTPGAGTVKNVTSDVKSVARNPALVRDVPPQGIRREPLQATLKRHRVGIVDGRAVVSAQVQVFDQEPNHSYLWVLRVVSPQREVLQKWVYDHQIFTVNLGEEVTPSFQEAIDIPPDGSYVQAALYRFPTGTDPSFLAVTTEPKPFELVYGSNKISRP